MGDLFRNSLFLSLLVFLYACGGNPCKKSMFEAYLNETNWDGCIESFDLNDEDIYDILVLESIKKTKSPDELFIKGFQLSKFKKVFNEENIDSFPTIVFNVVVFDSIEDTYRPIPDGKSWIEIESIDPETNVISMRFHLHLLVSRPGGPINTTYGDTIVFSGGLIQADPCN